MLYYIIIPYCRKMSAHSHPPSGVELKHTKTGDVNHKYIDLLEEDKPIAGQKFACVSFVSPENILKQKEIFFFSHIRDGSLKNKINLISCRFFQ